MDYMKLVADLCQIIDRQNEITKAMAVQLGQRDALRYEEEMAAVRRDYDTAMGEVDPCKNCQRFQRRIGNQILIF